MVRLRNILWIVTTQWRGQAFGGAGDRNARTPCVDRLAAEGLSFSHAVTPHPFGPFARAALLTGVPSPANGVRDYFDPLPSSARTIAHELADRGYDTAFFGKWHLGERAKDVPLVGDAHARVVVPRDARGGFGFWEGFESGFLLNDPWLHGDRLPQPTQFAGYQSDVICERAASFLSESPPTLQTGVTPKRPWFAMVSLEAPHPPYDAASAGAHRLEERSILLRDNVPRAGEAETQARRELAGYYAHIEATDTAIGRLLAALEVHNPIVVFTSVHGDMLGSHGLFRKGWPFEESVRIPFVVRGDARLSATALAKSAAVSLLDLHEMTLAWAEDRIPSWNERASLISMPSVVALRYQCDRAWRGVRTPARKLVLNSDGTPWLFFDLERDPLESTNRVADPLCEEEIRQLRETLR
jgi:arylsulfatase A-like enzyme